MIVPGSSRYFSKVSGGGPTSYYPILQLYSEVGFLFYDLSFQSSHCAFSLKVI
jgi:hypothetical protein